MKTIYEPSEDLLKSNVSLRDEFNLFVRELQRSKHAPTDQRLILSEQYLQGSGLEIGAFHCPLPLPGDCTIDYIDKFGTGELKILMPEHLNSYCIYPNFIGSGETLDGIGNDSYDFLVANHMLEHSENTYRTIERHCQIIKPQGYIFYALPDKRYTFDKERTLTSYDHLLEEYYNGSQNNRVGHYREFFTIVDGMADNDELEQKVNEYIEKNRDIHFHVWEKDSFLTQIDHWIFSTSQPLEIITCIENGTEFITLLKKL